nr:uncharacterized mitochondrial protein AtMg00810-like [Tanacetum cinerariifolium]
MDVKSAFLYDTIDEEVYGKDGSGKDVDLHLYRSMIGSLMYLIASRPDIMFVVCACARHQVTPKECHLHAVKRIFRYLKGHPKLGLWYPKESPFDLVAYSDSDYGGASQDRKSTIGGCLFLGRRLISWQCKKQAIVATSTTEAKYVAAASSYGQVLWIQNQLLDYGYNFMNTKIYIDNNSAICSACHERLSLRESHHLYYHSRLAFCDYHNMVAILEKYEQNIDFHPIVDFVEASHIRYALTFNPTIYVSHIRQFWSTARIETTEEGTKILATVDGILRTVTESSIRRNLKLNDEEGLSSLPDAELFENLTLMGYNISPNQKFTFQKGQFSHQWKYLIHTIMQCLSPKSTGFNEFSSNIATALVCLATNRTYNFSKIIFDGLGEGSETPTEPHYTPSPEAQQPSHTPFSSPTLPPVTISSSLPPVADETASPLKDVSQGEACLTDSGFVADPDRANITKTSTLPHESTSRVTSLAADEGSIGDHRIKGQCKFLEDRQGEGIKHSRDDAPIKGRRLDEEEAATERLSSDTKEIRLDEGEATAKRVVPTAVAVPTATVSTPTGSGVVSTASPTIPIVAPIFATAATVTPYTRQKRKEKMVETNTPKKKKRLQEQMDVKFARELEEELERDAQRMNEQIARDAEIARIHAEEELQIMIDGLDRSNETVAKYLQEYHQFATELPIEKRIDLICDLDRGMTFEELEAKFTAVWKQVEDFIPMGSKKAAERLKRKGIRFEQESMKKLKTSEVVPKEVKIPDEVPEEKELLEDHKTRRQLSQLPILCGSIEAYVYGRSEPVIGLSKGVTQQLTPTSDKEMELWVELKRLYEPDDEDQLWTHTQNQMHAPVERKLYDICGVHQVTSKDKEIFMLVEKDYPLRKGLSIVMICYKL